ncbi:MAG: METTL5 family protein [Candidatus Bathyarchaeia archaeon]
MAITRKQLEIALSRVRPDSNPKVHLEQYSTPSSLAASVLHQAAYTFKDIQEKNVVDLGCGTGILAIGSALLGALYVVGVDADQRVLRVAKENARTAGVSVDWVASDINNLRPGFDTVIQNPPFGVQRRGADTKFLKKGLKIARVVYSLHKSAEKSTIYLNQAAELAGGKATKIARSKLELPHQFEFHRKFRHRVEVDVYRFTR